jgi:hypothetical protein
MLSKKKEKYIEKLNPNSFFQELFLHTKYVGQNVFSH